jgi:SNF2 family DNA or RNA helicase
MSTAAALPAAVRTCGEVHFKKHPARVWVIAGEAHVRLRLKRVFGKADRSSVGAVEISDTIENCRDLAWFMERYPLAMSAEDRAYLERRASEHRARAEVIEQVTAEGYHPREFALAVPPREYQRLAADLVLRTGGTLLADDVGLGKTASAICVLTDPRTRPALVVTLTHLPRQWADEIAKFAPQLRTHIVKKGKPYPLFSQPTLPGVRSDAFPDVIICNYHKLAGWAEALRGVVKTVIWDEVQELRRRSTANSPSAKYDAAIMLAEGAEVRMGLSATPIYNYGAEMWAVLSAIRPGALGSLSEFTREWCDYGGEKVRDPKAFGGYLRSEGLMLRRTRAEVGRELPDLTKVTHHIDADPAALDQVQDRAAELARIILAQGGQQLERGAQMRAAEEISYLLRQATGIAKAPYVAEFVRLLVESGEKVVVYGWHREVYAVLMSRLRDLGPVMYTGTESAAQKEEAKKAFVAGDARVLLMSLRAGAGLDGLQGHCRTVVFGELDWSPGVHEQCIGRVHRDGQTEKVVAYYLVSDRGSDPVVADVLGLKRAQIEGVRDPDASLIEKLETGGGHARRLAEAYLSKCGRDAAEVS